jgi:hypothetical protein
MHLIGQNWLIELRQDRNFLDFHNFPYIEDDLGNGLYEDYTLVYSNLDLTFNGGLIVSNTVK